jgi:hypothetical protein
LSACATAVAHDDRPARSTLTRHNTATSANRPLGTPSEVTFIHRHPDLHAAVQTAAALPAEPAANNTTVSVASLRADLLNTRAHNTRLQQHIRTLENRLSQSLGEDVFRDSGLGAPDDIRSLQQALADREQQLLELRRQLEERGDELAAARAANRELMARLNTRS